MRGSECGVCHHDDHDAGRCKKCNCGESEIVRPRTYGRIRHTDLGDYVERIYATPSTIYGERHYWCQN